MSPTPDELELATAAAAEALFSELRRLIGDTSTWHDLPDEARGVYLHQARPVAAAVLAAIPDRGPAAARLARRQMLGGILGALQDHPSAHDHVAALFGADA